MSIRVCKGFLSEFYPSFSNARYKEHLSSSDVTHEPLTFIANRIWIVLGKSATCLSMRRVEKLERLEAINLHKRRASLKSYTGPN
jgi:hypothetical protein